MVSTFECSHCKKKFKENRILREHVKLYHDGIDLPPCNRSGRKPRQINDENLKQPTIKCAHCEKFFYCKSSVVRHQKTVHQKNNFYGVKTRPSKSKNIKREYTYVKQKCPSITCSICGKNFNYESSLIRHTKISHILPKENVDDSSCNKKLEDHNFNSVAESINFDNGDIHITIIKDNSINIKTDISHYAKVNAFTTLENDPSKETVEKNQECETIFDQSSDNSCWKCGKNFSMKKYCDRHMFMVHKIKATVRMTVQCPLCPITVQNRFKLNEHLSFCHEVCTQTSKFELESMEEFKQWKENMEQQTTAFYYLSNTKKNKTTKKFIFTCNRSGKYVPKQVGERKRKAKRKGLRKTVQTCPAFIRAIQSDHNSGKISVTFCETHIGHVQDLSHINLSTTIKKTLSSELQDIPKTRALQKLIGSFNTVQQDTMIQNNEPTQTELDDSLNQFKMALSEEFNNILNNCVSNDELSVIGQGISAMYPALEQLRTAVLTPSLPPVVQFVRNVLENKEYDVRQLEKRKVKKQLLQNASAGSNDAFECMNNMEAYAVNNDIYMNNNAHMTINADALTTINLDSYRTIDVNSLRNIKPIDVRTIDPNFFKIMNINSFKGFNANTLKSMDTNATAVLNNNSFRTLDDNAFKTVNINDLHTINQNNIRTIGQGSIRTLNVNDIRILDPNTIRGINEEGTQAIISDDMGAFNDVEQLRLVTYDPSSTVDNESNRIINSEDCKMLTLLYQNNFYTNSYAKVL